MPDDNSRSQMIESRIDRTIAGGLPVAAGHGGAMALSPRNMGEILEFAKIMAVSGDMIRPAFRNNPGACLGICMVAFRAGGDPFAFANKAYLTRNKAGETQVAYEAQLVDAVVNSSGVLARRLRLSYDGQGVERRCTVLGWIKGEDEPFPYESPPIKTIAVKNSPLWTGDPDQQLAYYSKRAWARRWVPEVLLGIPVAGEDGEIIDVTATEIGAHAAALQPVETKRFVWQAVDHAGEVYEFRTPERAVEACRKILITAAAIDQQALATAWENNEPFVATLHEAEYGSDADALLRLLGELSPTPAATATQDTPAQDEPAQRPATEAEPDQNETAEEYSKKQPDPARPEAQDEHTAAPAAAEAQPESAPPSGPQSGERHDPFWDRDSLRVEAPLGRAGKPDWKAWTALLFPRIRQAWSIPLLTELEDANRDLIESYASNFGSRARDEMAGEFEQARGRLS